jgi:hypothetical protein
MMKLGKSISNKFWDSITFVNETEKGVYIIAMIGYLAYLPFLIYSTFVSLYYLFKYNYPWRLCIEWWILPITTVIVLQAFLETRKNYKKFKEDIK